MAEKQVVMIIHGDCQVKSKSPNLKIIQKK